MNPLLSVLLGTATLCTQAPLPQLPAPVLPQPKNLVAPTTQPASAPQADTFPAAATPAPQHLGVLFDPLPDALWARGDTWKASFDANGATFVPFLGSQAPRNFPVRFQLADLHVGGQALPVGAAAVARDGTTAVLQRTAVREEYVASDAGIEQRFVFTDLPQRGALTVGIDATGEFAVTADADGHRFTNEHGSFRYGRAVALDAKGDRVDLTTTWNGARFTITVPASFVERAQLPLVVDPLIGGAVGVGDTTYLKTASDIAYDASLNTFVTCWSFVFSGFDYDLYVQPLTDAMLPNGPIATIDITSAWWDHCRIANLAAYDTFLVVAERVVNFVQREIVSRTYAPTGSVLGTQTLLSQGSDDQAAPDVGGDPSPLTPTYFTVVWEHTTASGTRDIDCVQVRNTGVRIGTPTTLAGDYLDEHAPSISPTNGRGPTNLQDWLVAFRAEDSGFSATMGAFVTWNGAIRPINGQATFPIALGGEPGYATVAVSSPTDPSHGNQYMVVDIDQDPLHGFQQCLRASVVDRSGAVVALNARVTGSPFACLEPAVDTDGARFAISFLEIAQPSMLNIGTYDVVGQQVVQHERVLLGASGTHALNGGLVSMHGAGGAAALDREYAISWIDDPSAGLHLYTRRYRGMAGIGIGIRATGCGPLAFAYGGVGAIGTSITFQQSGGTGIGGFAFGSPISAPLPQCPGCTLGSSADVLLLGNSVGFVIPFDTSLVGVTVSMQGFDYGVGTCLGALWLGDTADLAIH